MVGGQCLIFRNLILVSILHTQYIYAQIETIYMFLHLVSEYFMPLPCFDLYNMQNFCYPEFLQKEKVGCWHFLNKIFIQMNSTSKTENFDIWNVKIRVLQADLECKMYTGLSTRILTRLEVRDDLQMTCRLLLVSIDDMSYASLLSLLLCTASRHVICIHLQWMTCRSSTLLKC